jgi:predicted NBD/HSP70 family sugar kinase
MDDEAMVGPAWRMRRSVASPAPVPPARRAAPDAEPVPARPAAVRAANDRLALDLLLTHGALAAADLRELTGLSGPTISALLTRLREAGLVLTTGESEAVRRGPAARLYAVNPHRAYVAGVDIRTDRVTAVAADLAGATVADAEYAVKSPRTPVGPLVTGLVRALQRGDRPPHTVVVGAPGLVDPATGQLRSTTTLPSWHESLVTALRRRLAAPVVVENEVNLAALAELREGAARDRDSFVLLWLGHGAGAGTVLDGRLRRGASGGAGEIGFLAVPGEGGLVDGCPSGFHSLVSSAAVCSLAARHGLLPAPAGPTDGGDSPVGAAGGSGVAAAEAAVRAALAAGQRGEAFLDELAGSIALGALAICVVLDPGCLVLGGELGRAGGAALAERVAARLAERSPVRTDVRASEVPGSPVLTGAVLTALDAARTDLFGPPTG